MKVYKIGDCDYFAAESMESALTVMIDLVGEEEAKEYLADIGYEVSDDQMDILKIIDADDDQAPPVTFREELNRMLADGKPFPRNFCSTEY